MKAIVCEMCGSQELIKQDGMYVCQNCHTKYDPEEARKLMIEVSGSIKVDNSDLVQKSLQNARRAKQKEDWEETEKYYNLVEQNEPNNIEAIFYSAYAKAKTSLVDGDIFKRKSIFKILQNCVSIIDDNYLKEKEDEEKEIIIKITDDIIGLSNSSYVYTQTETQYGTTTNKSETEQLFLSLISEWDKSLKNIIKMYPGEEERIEYIFTLIIKLSQYVIDHFSLTDKSKTWWNDNILTMHKESEKTNPRFVSNYMQEELIKFQETKEKAKKERLAKEKESCGCILAIVAIFLVGFAIFVAIGVMSLKW